VNFYQDVREARLLGAGKSEISQTRSAIMSIAVSSSPTGWSMACDT
jgi:hypothetical protein